MSIYEKFKSNPIPKSTKIVASQKTSTPNKDIPLYNERENELAELRVEIDSLKVENKRLQRLLAEMRQQTYLELTVDQFFSEMQKEDDINAEQLKYLLYQQGGEPSYARRNMARYMRPVQYALQLCANKRWRIKNP